VKTCALTVAILFCVAAGMAAQTPDFTGVWLRGDGADTTRYTIDQRGGTLNLSHDSSHSAGTLSARLMGSETYIADGVERTAAGKDRESWTTVYWQGPSLVILRVVKESYRVSVTRETWSLSGDGLSLTRDRRRIDMDGVTSQTETYRKQ